jgi:RimJ/RimL family protein N-acetyltransferase
MIDGKRVRLRAIEEPDLALLAQWMNDPDISSSVVGWSFPVSAAEQRVWYTRSMEDRSNKRFMVEAMDTGETIGLTGLWEIDWHNRHALTALKIGAKNIQGKGYGTDAIMTLMSYAFFGVGLQRLWGEMLPFNAASYGAYVSKCGWRVEGVLRNHVFRDGRMWDLIRVASLREEFENLSRAKDYLPTPRDERIVIDPAHLSFDVERTG